MPGAGAIVAAVVAATGREPEMYAGKPSAFLLELLKGNYVDMAKTLVVGDRLDTDVAFGKAGNAGMTVMTLSGVSTMEDVDEVIARVNNGGASDAILPDHIVQSLPEMLGLDPEMAGIIEMADVNADDEADARGAVDEYLEDEGWGDDGDEDDEYN
jgi:ribonucleotide monophosphatase NagD (HAD superfamily)